MGRLSQMFWALNAKEYPTKQQRQHYYSHLDLSGSTGVAIKHDRRAWKCQFAGDIGLSPDNVSEIIDTQQY